MIESIPKFAELKTLKELSKVLVVPLLVTAFLTQTNFTFFGLEVDLKTSMSIQIFQFIAVLVSAIAVIGGIAWGVHDLLVYLQIITQSTALLILSTVSITLGLLGIFGEKIPLLMDLNHLWFYGSFVCGFYFLARAADIEKML
ncbi:hypothetical protein [Endozoicomonas elysicola]|uniref:Uncharacterized protein n=1 Tax=Endozoicomonas elysicola TaxID=305900 RepID=A0A081K847_9GAMM|nr:hypothetical protein [Endozoicomonas elysicola]KEI70323.1 hypothetical protein GV64_05875 [Endozoicomonas elysicola]